MKVNKMHSIFFMAIIVLLTHSTLKKNAIYSFALYFLKVAIQPIISLYV
jgi:hypothetical protein